VSEPQKPEKLSLYVGRLKLKERRLETGDSNSNFNFNIKFQVAGKRTLHDLWQLLAATSSFATPREEMMMMTRGKGGTE